MLTKILFSIFNVAHFGYKPFHWDHVYNSPLVTDGTESVDFEAFQTFQMRDTLSL